MGTGASGNNQVVLLDLNNPTFQQNLFDLDADELKRAIKTLEKLRKMTWGGIYTDHGLRWEKITSVTPPKGIEAIYSLRITQARRATAYRDGAFLRLLTIPPDHDATYGKK
ncbi:hypothetical protein [Cupriavidus necator]